MNRFAKNYVSGLPLVDMTQCQVLLAEEKGFHGQYGDHIQTPTKLLFSLCKKCKNIILQKYQKDFYLVDIYAKQNLVL